ncbi:MAG: hypothetical protein IPM82_28545 [Saprospiraceae bacterium]|nr:hypothetical protein [Saprospiraceae bacterium]
MTGLKILLSSLLLAGRFSIIAQQSNLPSHEIGVSFFAFERNSETQNILVTEKWLPSVYFNQNFKNWTWSSSLAFGKNQIDDRPEYCGDCIVGTGDMTEFIAATGLQYRFLEGRKIPVKPFLELDGFYSNIRYAGSFSGGRDGQHFEEDNTRKLFGLSGKIGLSYRPVPQVSITILSGRRRGKGKGTDNYRGVTKMATVQPLRFFN